MSSPETILRLNAALEGRYRIERELGEGGMATVYLADDVRHERKVALKVLKPELAAVVGAERFLAEIRTTANLQHPHILGLYDSGEADGLLFYVMPYVEGESLRERLHREHQLPVDEAVQIAKNVAEALDYAHAQGVIHRDIKPANVLLQAGKPVVSDFGIALAISAGGGNRITETGLSLGTPHYMSPEQATGDLSVGPGADIYALGCVLYEMLVGEPPFTGVTPQAVLGKIVTGEAPSARKERKSVPPNADAAIRKALEKLPADRFPGARYLAEALSDGAFRYGEGAAGAGDVDFASNRGWKRFAAGFAVLAAVMTLAFGWALLRPVPQGQGTVRLVLSTNGWAGLDLELARYMALAPDGSSMVLPLGEQLGLKLSGSADVTPIPGTEGARDVTYSPDGSSIAYAVGTEVHRLQLLGGSPVRLAEDGEAGARLAMAWLDDGTLLYERPGGEIGHIPANGGDALASVTGTGPLIWMHALPGARGALTVSSRYELRVVNLREGDVDPLLDDVARAWYAPTGHLVYVRTDGAVFGSPFDVQRLAITGDAVPLFSDVRLTNGRADMHLASDGTILYVEGSAGLPTQARRLSMVDREGTIEALPVSPRNISSAGWSPDGESIVFASDGHIYTYSVVLNNPPRQITFEGDNDVPVFSPDGRTVVFSSLRSETEGTDLFVKDLDTASALPELLLSLGGDQTVTDWPADTLILFQSVGLNGVGDLWLIDLSEPEAPDARPYLEEMEANLRSVTLSPNGTWAAYRSFGTGAGQNRNIYINRFPNPGVPERVSADGWVPMWSPAGQTLYYAVGPGRAMAAARIQQGPVPVVLEIDTVFFVPPFTAAPHPGSALDPKGERFLLAVGGDRDSLFGGASEERQSERLILVQNFFEELRERVPAN